MCHMMQQQISYVQVHLKMYLLYIVKKLGWFWVMNKPACSFLMVLLRHILQQARNDLYFVPELYNEFFWEKSEIFAWQNSFYPFFSLYIYNWILPVQCIKCYIFSPKIQSYDKCFLGSSETADANRVFCGQLGAVYVFTEALNPAQIFAIHQLGPGYKVAVLIFFLKKV